MSRPRDRRFSWKIHALWGRWRLMRRELCDAVLVATAATKTLVVGRVRTSGGSSLGTRGSVSNRETPTSYALAAARNARIGTDSRAIGRSRCCAVVGAAQSRCVRGSDDFWTIRDVWEGSALVSDPLTVVIVSGDDGAAAVRHDAADRPATFGISRSTCCARPRRCGHRNNPAAQDIPITAWRECAPRGVRAKRG